MPWDNEPKNWLALLSGILLFALGLIPLLNKWKVINFPFLSESLIAAIASYLVAAAGVWLLIDSFMEDDEIRIISIVVAIALVVLGLVPVLFTFKIIGFNIPFLSVTFYYFLFVIEGLFLMIAAFAMQ